MKEEIFVGLYRRDMYAKVCLAKGAKQARSGPDIILPHKCGVNKYILDCKSVSHKLKCR